MAYEIIVPEWKPKRLNEKSAECIECGEHYSEKLGGIVWDGRGVQYFICGACSHYVVPALANDYRHLILDQRDKLRDEVSQADIRKINRHLATRRLDYFVTLVNVLYALDLLKRPNT